MTNEERYRAALEKIASEWPMCREPGCRTRITEFDLVGLTGTCELHQVGRPWRSLVRTYEPPGHVRIAVEALAATVTPADVERMRKEDIEKERARRAALPLEKCRAWGHNCSRLTPGGYECERCVQEYLDDPDAFK